MCGVFLTSRQSLSFSGGPFMDRHWSLVYILIGWNFPMVVHLWITVGDSLSLISIYNNAMDTETTKPRFKLSGWSIIWMTALDVSALILYAGEVTCGFQPWCDKWTFCPLHLFVSIQLILSCCSYPSVQPHGLIQCRGCPVPAVMLCDTISNYTVTL